MRVCEKEEEGEGLLSGVNFPFLEIEGCSCILIPGYGELAPD
jgi:hypothetical protein